MQLPFAPMLLGRAPAPFADDGWLYQVKWDGVRNLTLVEDGKVRHWSRRGRERTLLFPELEGLGPALGVRRVVLDGELVALRDGKPSFPGILERDSGGRPDPAKVRTLPAFLMMFDLLELGDRPLYQIPVEERMRLLRAVVPPGPRWEVVESFPGQQGPELFQAAVENGFEGVVAKRLGSPYQPGVRSRDWLKVKHRQRLLAAVCGYAAPDGRPVSLLLGVYRGERLTYIGRVSASLGPEETDLLRRCLKPAPCPFSRVPDLRSRFARDPGPVVWTEPLITVNVEFSEWTEDLRLRDPILVGFSNQPAEAAQLR